MNLKLCLELVLYSGQQVVIVRLNISEAGMQKSYADSLILKLSVILVKVNWTDQDLNDDFQKGKSKKKQNKDL